MDINKIGEEVAAAVKDLNGTKIDFEARRVALQPKLKLVWKAFKDGKTVNGCTSKKQWAKQVAGCDVRNVQYILAGGNKKRGDAKHVSRVVELVPGLVLKVNDKRWVVLEDNNTEVTPDESRGEGYGTLNLNMRELVDQREAPVKKSKVAVTEYNRLDGTHVQAHERKRVGRFVVDSHPRGGSRPVPVNPDDPCDENLLGYGGFLDDGDVVEKLVDRLNVMTPEELYTFMIVDGNKGLGLVPVTKKKLLAAAYWPNVPPAKKVAAPKTTKFNYHLSLHKLTEDLRSDGILWSEMNQAQLDARAAKLQAILDGGCVSYNKRAVKQQIKTLREWAKAVEHKKRIAERGVPFGQLFQAKKKANA